MSSAGGVQKPDRGRGFLLRAVLQPLRRRGGSSLRLQAVSCTQDHRSDPDGTKSRSFVSGRRARSRLVLTTNPQSKEDGVKGRIKFSIFVIWVLLLNKIRFCFEEVIKTGQNIELLGWNCIFYRSLYTLITKLYSTKVLKSGFCCFCFFGQRIFNRFVCNYHVYTKSHVSDFSPKKQLKHSEHKTWLKDKYISK